MPFNNLKILDCTLRDGGYYNNWNFNKSLISNYFKSIHQSKIEHIEIGFHFFEKNNTVGDIGKITKKFINRHTILKKIPFAIMVNASDALKNIKKFKLIIENLKDSKISMIRFACYFDELNQVNKLIKYTKNKGIDVAVNLMQINLIKEKHLIKKLTSLDKNIDVLYFADSLGNLKPKDIKKICIIFKSYWKKEFGIHAHDNQGYALINSLTAIKNGATWIDSTILGMGRGAGNVDTNQLLYKLNNIYNKKYNQDVIKKISKLYFFKLKNKYGWGKSEYYNLAGRYNIHPTYIQALLEKKRYSRKEILEIINKLKETESRSYDPIKHSRILSEQDKKGQKWNADKFLNGKTVILLGAGPSVKNIKKKIINLKNKKDNVIISININNYISKKYIDYFVTSNERRVILDIDRFKKIDKPLIIPFSRLKKYLRKAKNLEIFDYGIKLTNSFEVRAESCSLPSNLSTGYALALCTIGRAKKIMLAGFDGYKNEDYLNYENQTVFKYFKENYSKVNIELMNKSKFFKV